MPAHATGLKKYFGGIEVVSTTCHKKQAVASLWNAVVLGSEHAPGDAASGARHVTRVRPFAPWRFERTAFAGQCAQETAEGVAPVAEHTGDILPDDEGGRTICFEADLINDIGKFHITEGQSAAWIIQSPPDAGHAESLTGRATDQNVGRSHIPGAHPVGNRRHVAQIGHIRVMVGEYSAGKRFDFGEPHSAQAEWLPGEADGLDAAAYAAVLQGG